MSRLSFNMRPQRQADIHRSHYYKGLIDGAMSIIFLLLVAGAIAALCALIGHLA